MTLQNQYTASNIILFIWKENRPWFTFVHPKLFIFFRQVTPITIIHFIHLQTPICRSLTSTIIAFAWNCIKSPFLCNRPRGALTHHRQSRRQSCALRGGYGRSCLCREVAPEQKPVKEPASPCLRHPWQLPASVLFGSQERFAPLRFFKAVTDGKNPPWQMLSWLVMELLSPSCSSSRDSRSYSAVITSKTSFAKISAQHLEQGSDALTCLYGEKDFNS